MTTVSEFALRFGGTPLQADRAALAEPHLPGLDQYMGGPLLRGIGATMTTVLWDISVAA